MLRVTSTALPEVLIIEPKVFGDARGFFLESYNEQRFREHTGVAPVFVQDNHSRSSRGVLRGLHYQLRKPQAKLVRAVSGAVLDVAIDLRRSSPNFGRWVAVELSAENHRQLWVPEGFGHGFVALSETVDFLYKTTQYWFPDDERAVHWRDPALAIDWRFDGEPIVSDRDAKAPPLRDAEVYP